MKALLGVVASDVIETIFTLTPMREWLERLGLPGAALEIWFAQVLRNAFALDASGTYKSFGEVARGTLEHAPDCGRSSRYDVGFSRFIRNKDAP